MTNPATLLGALAFAAEKHRDQRRKDASASPYINHPIAVALILAAEGGVADEALLMAAVLHDTVEDTTTTLTELTEHFGADVANLVAEVTDDKRLPKESRKELQVEHAPHISSRAKMLKMADKISNIRDIVASPPTGWPLERKVEYLAWTKRVVAGCRGVNGLLEAAYDRTLETAAHRFCISL
jgi:guanosine-3',5'-bis(diphosphate) 3'-pyrophosphohydrolase